MSAKRIGAIGIACGILCAVLVIVYTSSVRADAESVRSDALARYGGEQVEVCVATNDIMPGDVVRASDVTTKLWVADLLPKGALKQTSVVVGKTASSSILAGEVILEGRFQSESSYLEVPSGLCAISVPAKSVQAVGGALSVGMSVDVYSTGNTQTTRLLSNVSVLATSTTQKSDSSNSKTSTEVQWITIAVPSEFVEAVVAAAQQSQLYFTLPNKE